MIKHNNSMASILKRKKIDAIDKALQATIFSARPSWWDVSQESWSDDDLQILADRIIPGGETYLMMCSRSVFVGMVRYIIERDGSWSWHGLVDACSKPPEEIFAMAASVNIYADEYVGGLLSVPFGERSRKTMVIMSGLIAASCRVTRYLQSLKQAS